jgi:mannose-6-phosphate isomerase
MMNLDRKREKSEIFETINNYLKSEGLNIVNFDDQRPWGGFFVIDEKQAALFISKYFDHLSLSDFSGFEKLSPKILVVAPEMRLSWQYHHRRAEIWKLIFGEAGVAISDSDEEKVPKTLKIGEIVELACGERHRLLGLNNQYGVVAEIWQHTDKNNPSDEEDIVRVQDDFGR